MSKPRITIIIPTYNHAQFLRKALDSVLAQTVTDWEAIVVNNFSEDDTIALVESYEDERIRLVNFANHGVIAASRNYGLSQTCAPYVAFLDSDDFWYPGKLAVCLARLDQGYNLVCHAEVWAGPAERRRTVEYGPEARASYDSLLLDGNCLSTSAVVVQREWLEKVGGFSERADVNTAEDYDLWLKLTHDGAKIGFVTDVLGEYLIHEGNQSRSGLRNMEAVLAVFNTHIAGLRDSVPAARIRRREAVIYYSGGRSLQDGGKHMAAWRYFFKAVFRYPLVPKFYAAMLLNALGRHP